MSELKIVNKFLPAHCYTAVNMVKKRICLHHTVSSPYSQAGDVATWQATRNIATTYIIGHDGAVYRCIPENYWAHHLGTKLANNAQLNQETIGIEIDAWGPFKKEGGQFINAYGRPLTTDTPMEEIDKPFRGYKYYQEYYQAQVDALYLLLKMLSVEHGIQLEGLNRTLNFEVLPAAELNKSGLFSHTNFRADKSDVYPARRLVAMLRML